MIIIYQCPYSSCIMREDVKYAKFMVTWATVTMVTVVQGRALFFPLATAN